MNTARIDKKGLVICLMFGPLFLFGAWGALTYHRDKQLPGVIDYKSGHTQKAILELQQYVRDHPCTEHHSVFDSKSEIALKYLGLAYLVANQNQKAATVFSTPCIDDDSNQYNLGVALMRLGKLQEARIAFKNCIKMNNGKFSDEALSRAAQAKLDALDKLR